METLKDTFNQYKWILLAGVIVAVLIALITANLHVLHFMKYKMQNNVEGVLSVLQMQINNEEAQDDWFFNEGMEYLLEQKEYSDEIKNFFEGDFASFNLEWKKEIINAYNQKRMNLVMSKDIMDVLLEYIDDEGIRSYLSRLDITDLEQGLVLEYGNNPVVNNEFVDELYKIMSVYPEKLTFGKFTFNLYEVLNYTGEHAEEKIQFIFSKVDSNIAKENIFKALRNQAITEEALCKWVEFFNATGLIAKNEYNTFNDIYSRICLLRTQYHELDAEEINLKNKIAEAEALMGDKNTTLEQKQAEANVIQAKITDLENSLNALTNYSYQWSLYIEKLAGTGSNEFVASVPRNGLFGVRPSDQKFVIKLTTTSFMSEGVYSLNAYYQGTKTTASGEEYAYYVEVSTEDINSIETKKAERDTLLEQLEPLKQEVSQLESELSTIKTEKKYDENKTLLASIDGQRKEYKAKVNEEIISIRKLFGFSNIQINIDETVDTQSTNMVTGSETT